jgi:TonB family protein
VSLEQFKTQILLLHSEQGTLESLSTGFNDRYTVHCATSGSEALNTLGETAIDVIVTTQNLPGMSGLDALREAKKRSPDTIGILLAGNNGEGVEALVGDKEVFQIVRGGVTPESLRGVIDNATRQNRLMALAESANDTTAGMDEPTEHIVMETSENGSTIISDGTDRMPALNPEKVSAEANVGSRAVDVLVLTKDQEFLTTVRESARGMHNVIYASTLAQADDAVRKQKIGVAIVDSAMVGDNVERLTAHLRTTSPRLVAIIAGRRNDGEMLMDLINRGKVYRFLLKPVSPGRARLAIEASVKHHLEAPDAAFRIAGATAAPKPVQKAPQPFAPPRPAPEQSQTVPKIEVEPRPVPVDSSSMMGDALSEAFGGDDKSFAETMTGVVRTVGESISSVTQDPSPMRLDSSDAGRSILNNPKLLGIGAASVIVLLGLGWWMFSGSDDTAPIEESLSGSPQVTAADRVFDAPVATVADIPIDELIDEARLATAAGQIFNPPGSNAIELYMAASQAAPDNVTVTNELSAVINQALGMAESSLLRRRSEDVSAALQRVALVDPDNARLPFLNAQLTQMQLRDFLDASRLGIREGRYEDAAATLNRARALGVENNAEVGMVADELSAALSEQRVDDVLVKANARLEGGQLTAPSNDNARYYFELALSNDPGNTAARQGLNVIASKLVLQARTEIDAGQFDAAENLLADARRLDPSSSELAASLTALATARDQQKQAVLAADSAAAEALAAERLAAEQAAAEQVAEKQVADESPSEAMQIEEPVAEGLPATTSATAPPAEPADVVKDNVINNLPIAASALQRTRYVAPKYPRSAQRRNISGWVDVIFTVDIDGTVKETTVRDSNPGNTFVNAAVDAVQDWEFAPVIENGSAVEKRAAVRMMFAIE